MIQLKIAYTPGVEDLFTKKRERVQIGQTDYTDIAAAVVTDQDLDVIDEIHQTMSSGTLSEWPLIRSSNLKVDRGFPIRSAKILATA